MNTFFFFNLITMVVTLSTLSAPSASRVPGGGDPARLRELDRLEAELRRQQGELTRLQTELQAAGAELTSLTAVLDTALRQAGKEASGLHPFVFEARKWAGVPYVFGGASSRGIDCSGLILRVAQSRGYRVPHNAALLFGLTRSIARAAMKPGDLVFFRDTYKPGISHVGIYLGLEKFVHAAGTGKGVIVSRLDEARYAEKFVGARRLEPQPVPRMPAKRSPAPSR